MTQRRRDEPKQIVPAPKEGTRALSTDDDLPVVARMVVEIRSDGSRTVARGAIEDTASGQKHAVVARGGTPLALAADLTRGLSGVLMKALPRLGAAQLLGRLLGGREKKR